MRKLTFILLMSLSLSACKPGAVEGSTDLLAGITKILKIFGKKSETVAAPQAAEWKLDPQQLAALKESPKNDRPDFYSNRANSKPFISIKKQSWLKS